MLSRLHACVQGRVTPQDKAAVQLLARGASDDELRTFFETLRFKRTDQSGLCTLDLLRRCAAPLLPRCRATCLADHSTLCLPQRLQGVGDERVARRRGGHRLAARRGR